MEQWRQVAERGTNVNLVPKGVCSHASVTLIICFQLHDYVYANNPFHLSASTLDGTDAVYKPALQVADVPGAGKPAK
jgi:hypothetical protein